MTSAASRDLTRKPARPGVEQAGLPGGSWQRVGPPPLRTLPTALDARGPPTSAPHSSYFSLVLCLAPCQTLQKASGNTEEGTILGSEETAGPPWAGAAPRLAVPAAAPRSQRAGGAGVGVAREHLARRDPATRREAVNCAQRAGHQRRPGPQSPVAPCDGAAARSPPRSAPRPGRAPEPGGAPRQEGALGKRQSRKVRALPGSERSSRGLGRDAPALGAQTAPCWA